MQTKTSLLGGAAFGVLIALSMTAAADAKTVKHHHKAASGPSEVQQLRAEVQALESRLDEATYAQQQTSAQVAAAQAAAASAKASSDAAASAIKTIPTQVSTAVSKSYKPGWYGDTTVGGRVYANLSNITHKNGPVSQPNTGTGVDIKRFYINVDHKFNSVYSANLTTDFQYDGTLKATELYIKKAYLQAHYADELNLQLGSADLPWVPFVENIYGYRYAEQVLIDRAKFGTSADWGIHANGKFAGGMVNYAVAVVNGGGYKNPTRAKSMDVEGRLSINPTKEITLAIGGYEGKLGKTVTTASPSVIQATFHTASRVDLLAAYVNAKFRVGAEYFSATNWNQVTAVPSDKSDGYSLFGSFNVTPKVAVFGKYEYMKPSKTLTPTQKEDGYYNLGVSYSPAKTVDLALIYKHDQVDNGGPISLGDVFGGQKLGPAGGGTNGKFDEIGLYTQVKF